MKTVLSQPLLSLAILLPAFAAGSAGASWDVSADLDLTARIFAEAPRWAGQDDATVQTTLGGSAEFRWRGDDARASIVPTLRYDANDDERSLADLKEAYWAQEGDGRELLAGVNTVFWGVTESVHLVDIVNQTDAVADIDGEDKLGAAAGLGPGRPIPAAVLPRTQLCRCRRAPAHAAPGRHRRSRVRIVGRGKPRRPGAALQPLLRQRRHRSERL